MYLVKWHIWKTIKNWSFEEKVRYIVAQDIEVDIVFQVDMFSDHDL